MSQKLAKPFLLTLIFAVMVAVYFVFRPFLIEILVAAILASVFYRPYNALTKFLKGRHNLAALLMCLLLVVIIILPTIKLIVYASETSLEAYNAAVTFFNKNSVNDLFNQGIFIGGPLRHLGLNEYDFNGSAFREVFLEALKSSSNWLVSGATIAFKETTNFVISLVMIIIALFFFFVDGRRMLQRLMYLSPLPNKYDQELFRKFQKVSYTTFVSNFVAAIGQGLVAALGFAIIGFPVLLAGILVALLSLIPYIGSMIFYVPVGIYYLLVGEIWQGIFILLWGMAIISTVDNVIRTYMIKDEAEINPVFILFSIMGGISLFGFWGVIIGPLIVALAVTVFHIYELEFCESLESEGCGEIAVKEKAEQRRFLKRK